MSRNDREVSLKQGQALWRGLSDSSDTFPTEGTFATLRNGIISRDGTEIITAPGVRRSGRPYYLDGGEVNGFDGANGGGCTIAGGASSPVRIGFNEIHYLELTSSTLDYLMRVDGNGTVADGYYLARNESLASAGLNVIYNGSAVVPDAAGSAFFARIPISEGNQYGSLNNGYKNGAVNPFHGIAQAGNYPVIVANCASVDDATFEDNRDHIAAWVADSVLSFDSPPSDWPCWYSVVSLPFNMARDGQTGHGGLTDGGLHMPARRRGVLDVTNDDLLLAIPGHGVCHRVAASFKNKDLYSGYAVTMLGVPKAMVFSAAAATVSGASLTAGTYWVAVAYKKWTTGEIGLPSDPVQVTLSGGENTITVTYWSARTLVPEFGGDYSVLVYLSARNSVDSGVLQVVQEDTVGLAAVSGTVVQAINVTVSSALDRRFPRLTQHPYGASWIKTVRGLTFGGGLLGSNVYDDETDFEQYSFSGTAGSNEILIRAGQTTSSGVTGRLNALSRLPNGFAGFEVMVSEGSNQVLAGGIQRLDAQIPQTASSSNSNACLWKLSTALPINANLASAGTDTMKVLFPRGMVWNSEPGLPGVSPSVSRTIVDRIQGRDFIAAARIGQSLLMMTEKETFLFSWGRSPLGEDAVLIDDTFGCIAPNSVVEFEGTAAWLSHLGPVALMGNRVEWIGKRVFEYFNSLKRDSRGLMNHAQGVHDPARKLVMWPVRSDWGANVTTYASQADDDVKSFHPNDEWLIWNYEVDSFQTMRYAEGRNVNVVSRMRHDDGLWRTAFVSNIVDVSNMGSTAVAPRDFFDVYSLEDGYVDHRDQPLEVTATEGPSVGSATYFVGSSGSFTGVRTGDYAFIRTGDSTLNWHGTVGTVTTVNASNDAIEIVSPGSGTWDTGAVIEIGVMPPMVMQSHKMRVGDFRRGYILNSVTVRHRLRRPYPSESTFHGWVEVTATNEDGDSVTFHPGLPSSVTSADSISRVLSGSQTKLDNGDMRGNDLQVQLTFITDGIIHVKDVVLEVNQGG